MAGTGLRPIFSSAPGSTGEFFDGQTIGQLTGEFVQIIISTRNFHSQTIDQSRAILEA
jgi:hypothetical protein